jgi:3',5'-nucleoside bisphosphate phosphatase
LRNQSSKTKPTRNGRAGSADLHVHTTHSDGVCSPCEVVIAAANVGLSALVITDHDTLSALAVARPEAARLGLELVAGIELTAEFEEREVHILGHFVRDDDPAIAATASALRIARAGRLRWIGSTTTPGPGLQRLRQAASRAVP